LLSFLYHPNLISGYVKECLLGLNKFLNSFRSRINLKILFPLNQDNLQFRRNKNDEGKQKGRKEKKLKK